MKLMNWIGKIVRFSLLAAVLFVQMGSMMVFAGDTGGTVLPGTEKTVKDCKELMNAVENFGFDDEERQWIFSNDLTQDIVVDGITFRAYDLLACGIKTGQIRLWMVPYYIRYILEFVIGIGGLIAVGGIVYGGYLYLFAGISEDKDKGKKAIMYGVAGMVMTLVAWAVVNMIISVVTA